MSANREEQASADIGGHRRIVLVGMVERLVGVPVEVRAINDCFVAVLVDRALLGSPTWQALRTGPAARIAATPEEACLLLAYAAGRAAAGERWRAVPGQDRQWLQNILQRANGPVAVREALLAAKAAGIADTALRRASIALGVVRTKAGMRGGWTWALPAGQTAAVPEMPEGERVNNDERAGATGQGI